jgi:predicted GNAT superfamily acetyltransferase
MSHTYIQPLRSSQQFKECEDIQIEVWGKLAVSAELLKVTQQHGGTVLGALVNGKICGFVYAFLARYHGRLVHWSHLMAVREKERDQGLGLRMKHMHRRVALQQGIRSICWTFDPLQSRNALLNISRLGADVEEYVPDCYGPFASIIEKGLPSDRFVVNWRIATARVRKHLQMQFKPRPIPSLLHVNETTMSQDGFLENRRIIRHFSGNNVLVEIPACTDAMRRDSAALAYRWRTETRTIFRQYFKAGYRVGDFIRERDSNSSRCFYVLSRPTRTARQSGSTRQEFDSQEQNG